MRRLPVVLLLGMLLAPVVAQGEEVRVSYNFV